MRLALVGDFMPAGLLESERDVAAAKAGLWAPPAGADVILANFECPITAATTPRVRKTYNFRTGPPALGLFDSRFVLHLANNHIMDYGERGLRDTLEALEERRIPFAGAGCDREQASRPVVVESGGFRIGIICAADPRFEPAGASRPGSLPVDEPQLRRAIEGLRASGAAVVVSLHMGIEYSCYPSPWMEGLARRCAEWGAGVVAFHHSHCLSGLTRLNDTPVLWGLGNYLFSPAGTEGFRPWYDGAVWSLDFDVASGRVEHVNAIPVELNAAGVPQPATGPAERRIRATLERLSGHLRSGRCPAYRRGLGFLSPSYVLTTGRNHLDSLRREGLRRAWEGLRFTLKSHLGRR